MMGNMQRGLSKMTDMVKDLKAFHEAFDCARNTNPTIVDDASALLRAKLLISEASETVEAMANKDMVEILDGLVDTLYVTVGAAVSYGLGDILMEAFDLVHINNMSKLGPDGKPLKDASGKVIKPEGYKPVNLEALLWKHKQLLENTHQAPEEDYKIAVKGEFIKADPTCSTCVKFHQLNACKKAQTLSGCEDHVFV